MKRKIEQSIFYNIKDHLFDADEVLLNPILKALRGLIKIEDLE